MKLLFITCIPLLKVALSINTSNWNETSNATVILPKYRPKYARVADVVETIWQRPPEGVVLMGVLMLAHECGKQATDFFEEYLQDGSVFEGCLASYSGNCLGLPEERRFVETARQRGYLVMAITAGSGQNTCWDKRTDPGRVRRAINYVLKEERLRKETPVFAAGAKSGGSFLADIVESGLVKNLVCMSSICGKITLPRKIRAVPTVFVQMSQDDISKDEIDLNVRGLRGNGVPAKILQAKPMKVNADLLQRTMSYDEAIMVIQALRDGEYIDGFGMLKEDPLRTSWQWTVKKSGYPVLPNRDKMTEGRSGLWELLNVAWARAEFTSQYTHQILDFCEQMTEDADAAKQEL